MNPNRHIRWWYPIPWSCSIQVYYTIHSSVCELARSTNCLKAAGQHRSRERRKEKSTTNWDQTRDLRSIADFQPHELQNQSRIYIYICICIIMYYYVYIYHVYTTYACVYYQLSTWPCGGSNTHLGLRKSFLCWMFWLRLFPVLLFAASHWMIRSCSSGAQGFAGGGGRLQVWGQKDLRLCLSCGSVSSTYIHKEYTPVIDVYTYTSLPYTDFTMQ